MDGFDIAILSWFNQFARRSYVLDAMINEQAASVSEASW